MKQILKGKAGIAIVLIITHIIVGLAFVFICNSLENTKLFDSDSSSLITALESVYGEWTIVEDLGYHGITRSSAEDVFEVGKTVCFSEERFYYEGVFDISYPHISIEITSSPEMQQFDRMEYPHDMGFGVKDEFAKYAKIYIREQLDKSVDYFYILSDTEIILVGDVHHYYLAVKN